MDTDTPAGPAIRGAALIELDRATVCRGVVPVLHALSLRIEQGRHIAILGPNGCGKSTFVKLIHRELYAVARTQSPPVRVLGQTRWDVFALRTQLGLVSPDLQRDLLRAPGLTGIDAVICGFFASQRMPSAEAVTPAMCERAREALALVDAAHLEQREIAALSTGEARRVLIARALVHRPQALLLDEPTTGLDIAAQQHFLASLRVLARDGTTLVLVTHHVEEIIEEIDRVVLLRAGHVFADGAPADVLTSMNLSALYGMPLVVERRVGRYHLQAAHNIPYRNAAAD